MKINMKKLREAIRDIHREIRAQKGDGPSGAPTDYRMKVIKERERLYALGYKYETIHEWEKFGILQDVRKYATILYSISAHNKGKVHATKRRNPYIEAPNFVPYDHKTGKPKERQPKFLYPTLEDQAKLIEPFIHEFEQQTEIVR